MADGEVGCDVKFCAERSEIVSLQLQCSPGPNAPDVGLDFVAVARVGVSISIPFLTIFDGSRGRS